ncbi:ras-related and estrogen-regulated growth inhibitor-like protein [Argiope bruennichi]|uniref:ras-related and estrogen-regulated growth inhibitor-like protein n=1 Tax=Argiope bruennichi TaxID=94029 RepID=UPI0024944244|nr:ras-related and estrogen-regulated growth inhibitor-like protein [Argiope bruennichi]
MARNSKGVLGFLKIHTSKSVFVRIVVLGAQDVGKTALIVRFLTKKYVHEYIRGELHTYDRRVTVENRDFDIVLIDTPGSISLANMDQHKILDEVDGFVLVYSITDADSFRTSMEMLRMLRLGFKAVGNSPVCLIGNKTDLLHITQVPTAEGASASESFPFVEFRECSAADELESVQTAFNEFLKTVLKRALSQVHDVANFFDSRSALEERQCLQTTVFMQDGATTYIRRQMARRKENKSQNKKDKQNLHANHLTVSKTPSPRRHSAGNSGISNWFRRPRSSSASDQNRQRAQSADRTERTNTM